jgi:hypothetical protein
MLMALSYKHNYIIDFTCFLFVYIPTCLATNLLTYLFTYPPPLTYLLIRYTTLMSANIWYTIYEGIALNEQTTILIIVDLFDINKW